MGVRTLSPFKKIMLSLAVTGSAAGIAGLGTFASFTDTTSGTHTISSGTVDINLASAGADNRLTVNASNIVPGDTIQRRAKLTNAGTENLASLTLTTTAGTSNLLTTDATNGLKMKIEKCGGALGWLESTAPYTYTCDAAVPGDNLGTRTSVLARRAILGTDISLSSMSSTTAGNTDDVVVTVDLPTDAGNTFQNLSTTITYTFNATQRAATNK